MKKKNHSSLFLVFHNFQGKKKSELIPLVTRDVADRLTTQPQPLVAPTSHLSCVLCAASHPQLVLTKWNKELRY